jgi:hypothetical protein
MKRGRPAVLALLAAQLEQAKRHRDRLLARAAGGVLYGDRDVDEDDLAAIVLAEALVVAARRIRSTAIDIARSARSGGDK